MKHLVAVAVLTVIVALVVGFGLANMELMPTLASEEGKIADDLFALHIQVISFLFALISVFMAYSIVVFRRQPGDEEDGDYFHGHTTLEIVWTAVPLVVVLYFAYLGVQTLEESMAAEPDEMVIEITASQWSWRFDYPEQEISSTDLKMPLNRQVRFEMTSTDVIHSFWVPEFRLKQDTVPGMMKVLRIKPTKVGEYRVRCAEMCGQDHADMYAEVSVMEPADFEAWVAAESAPASDDPAERGAKVYELRGCVGCHTVNGSDAVGPSWLGVYGSEKSLDDGTSVVADEAYIRNSIINPNEQVVEGFAPIMPPSYGEQLSEEEINDLIEYIKSLGN
jgi:cytochrome c oxidase subunit 2